MFHNLKFLVIPYLVYCFIPKSYCDAVVIKTLDIAATASILVSMMLAVS